MNGVILGTNQYVTNIPAGLQGYGTNNVPSVPVEQQISGGGGQVQGAYYGGDSGGGSSYYGGGGGGYSAPRIDTAAIAQFDQGIGNLQAGINRTGTQLTQGISQVDADYQNAMNSLALSENQQRGVYTDNKTATSQEYVGSKNTIRSNAGSSLNSLRRMLGSRGAGGSRAYVELAPGAVARQATIQQAGVGNTFATNNRALDREWGNFQTGLTNQRASAESQRQQQRQAVTNQINQHKASLIQEMAKLQGQRAQAAGGNAVGAAAPYLAQANALLDSTANYRVDPIKVTTEAYKAPTLGSYTVNPNAAPTYNGQSQVSDYVSPYLAALTGKKQLGVPA